MDILGKEDSCKGIIKSAYISPSHQHPAGPKPWAERPCQRGSNWEKRPLFRYPHSPHLTRISSSLQIHPFDAKPRCAARHSFCATSQGQQPSTSAPHTGRHMLFRTGRMRDAAAAIPRCYGNCWSSLSALSPKRNELRLIDRSCPGQEELQRNTVGRFLTCTHSRLTADIDFNYCTELLCPLRVHRAVSFTGRRTCGFILQFSVQALSSPPFLLARTAAR